MRRSLDRPGARPHRAREAGASVGPGVRLSSVDAGTPAVGDTLVYRNSVTRELTVDCQDTTRTVVSVARAVGRRFALLEDTAVAGAFGPEDYDALTEVLDEVAFPVDSAYFGPPADIDGNDRVVVLFTAEVNRLTPRGSTTLLAGFFNPNDLADRQTCPAGNRAELLYVLAPDPGGRFSRAVSVEVARRNARSVVAHELQHLLTAQQRVTLGNGTFANLEEAWLSEGLAHVAEEVVGLRWAGHGTRSELGFGQATADLEAFNTYHLANFQRLGRYLSDPAGTQALGAAGGRDPGGEETLRMRGFGWLFTRWLADHYAPASPQGIVPGSGEERLFRELSTGGPTHLSGIANVERAVRAVHGEEWSWEALLAEYAPAPALDDVGAANLPPRARIAGWNLRDVFGGLHLSDLGDKVPFRQPYPLQVTTLTVSGGLAASVSFEVHSSAARYFALVDPGEGAAAELSVTTPTGAAPPAAARVRAVVTRLR